MPARMPQDNPDNMTIRPGIAAVERLGAAAERANYAFPHQYAKECLNAGATIRTPGGSPLRSEAAVFEAILLGGHDLLIEWPAVPEPETPRAPTTTGRTPPACSARGHGCNVNPCFGCPNA